LKETLTADAVGRANDRAWTAFDVGQQPFADSFEIACEVELRDGLAGAVICPEWFVRTRDRYTQHDGSLAVTRCSRSSPRRLLCACFARRRWLWHFDLLRLGRLLGF